MFYVSAAIKIVKSDTYIQKCSFIDMYSGMGSAVFELSNAHSFKAEDLRANNVTAVDAVKIMKNYCFFLFNIS